MKLGNLASVPLAVALVFAAFVGTGSASAKPPSFAIWAVQWKDASDKGLAGLDTCAKVFANDDDKAGACAVRALNAYYKTFSPRWQKALARLALHQTPACKVAIHAYWLDGGKAQHAAMLYLGSHPAVSATTLASDLKGEPFTTLGSLSDAAKAHAIRVCG